MRSLLRHSCLAITLVFAPIETGAAALPAAPDPACRYETRLDGHLSSLRPLDNTPASNPVTRQGAALGRVLFFDHALSANGLVACSSCHSQEIGFDDPTRFSIGFQGRITRRSAMALANARFNPDGRYFRDLRAESLEAQVLDPFTDEIEMGLNPGELVGKVAEQPYYEALFNAAFGDPAITQQRIAQALAQFVRSITSLNSRYDAERAKAGSPQDDFPGFSAQENRGKQLFMTPAEKGGGGCIECHESEAFIMIEPRDNGLPLVPGREDQGLGEMTGRPQDMGKFRAASLRNIALSAPYMHDGRFATLDEVIEHYSSGVAEKPNLGSELRDRNGKPAKLNLSREDQLALVAFLQSLTDENLPGDKCFSDPFRR